MPLPAQQVFTREFDADFFRLPDRLQDQIEAKIDALGARLATYPHHRLHGSENCRLRIGHYRVLYSFDIGANRLFLKTVGHRSEVYRDD